MVGVNAIGESRGLCLIYQEPQLLVPDFEESNTSDFLGMKSKFSSNNLELSKLFPTFALSFGEMDDDIEESYYALTRQ